MHGQPPKEGMSGSVQPQADYRSRGSARGAGAPLSRWERAAVSRLFVSGPRPSLGGHAALVFTLMEKRTQSGPCCVRCVRAVSVSP